MGHSLFALIARAEVLAPARVHGLLVELPQGFALLPLTKQLIDRFGPGPSTEPALPFLSEPLATWVAELSRAGAVAVVYTDYFGGVGEQAARVWRDGQHETWTDSSGPHERWPINSALAELGVVTDGSDAFDALGLVRFRHTEDVE